MKTKLKNVKKITGTNDMMFKAIMYRNEDILREVLNESMNEKVGNIKYLNVELSVTGFLEKGRRLDLYLEDEQSFVDIEVSENYSITIINRNIGSLTKMYNDTVSIGDDYTEYKVIKVINLIENKKCEDDNYTYYFRNEKGKVLSNKLIYSEIFISNLVDLWYNKNEQEIIKNRHLIMLGLNLESLKKFNLEYGDEIVDKYTKEFEKILSDFRFEPPFDKEEDERRIRNSLRKEAIKQGIEKGMQKGIKEGIKEGIKQGQQERNIEIAKSMLAKNMSLEDISDITKLSIEEINNLK